MYFAKTSMKDTRGSNYYFLAEGVNLDKNQLLKVFQVTLPETATLEGATNCRLLSVSANKDTGGSGTTNFIPESNKHGQRGKVKLSPMVNSITIKGDFLVMESSKEGQLRWREAVRALYGEEIK